jgi:hypothetical protein
MNFRNIFSMSRDVISKKDYHFGNISFVSEFLSGVVAKHHWCSDIY